MIIRKLFNSVYIYIFEEFYLLNFSLFALLFLKLSSLWLLIKHNVYVCYLTIFIQVPILSNKYYFESVHEIFASAFFPSFSAYYWFMFQLLILDM